MMQRDPMAIIMVTEIAPMVSLSPAHPMGMILAMSITLAIDIIPATDIIPIIHTGATSDTD